MRLMRLDIIGERALDGDLQGGRVKRPSPDLQNDAAAAGFRKWLGPDGDLWIRARPRA